MKNLGSIALLAALFGLFAACGGTPPKPLPAPLERALQLEQDGARRYARGEFSIARAHFAEAARLFTAIDDQDAALRNTLHQARAELADGQAALTLARLDRLSAAGSATNLDLLSLRAQAQLALGQTAAAHATLTAAFAACTTCPQQASLHLLAARLALDEAQAKEALTHARAAAGLLNAHEQPTETANAWRLQAEARLALGETTAALIATEAALDLDRQLARPEKIARDWLLIGDIQRGKVSPGTHSAGDGETASTAAAMAYRHALEIARAAGEGPLAERARQSLAAIGASAPR